jgi:hypothetical protein
MIVRMNNQSSFCYDNWFLAVIGILMQYIQYIHNFIYIYRFKSVLTYQAKNIKTILQYKESHHVIVIEWHRKTSLGGSQNNGQRKGGDHCCPHCDFTHLMTFYEDSIITSKFENCRELDVTPVDVKFRRKSHRAHYTRSKRVFF